MREHAAWLCAHHQVAWFHKHIHRCRRGWASREWPEIHTAPVRSAISYAIVLHEIGHIVGRYQKSRDVLVREKWAIGATCLACSTGSAGGPVLEPLFPVRTVGVAGAGAG
jgi:hypothetical protein